MGQLPVHRRKQRNETEQHSTRPASSWRFERPHAIENQHRGDDGFERQRIRMERFGDTNERSNDVERSANQFAEHIEQAKNAYGCTSISDDGLEDARRTRRH